ncbi:MAG TPA: ATP-binding protein [Gemmatimonadaceae bacterium]|nr:ATP-binding protein [Gemmatimonadaceae bacterium]
MTAATSTRTRWWLLWLGTLAATTVLMLLARDRLDKAHVALVYLLVVLGGSALGGRVLGLTLAATAFLLFDVVFLPPYYRLQVADPLDWIVLIVFLITGVVAAELLERQRHEAEVARARTVEIDRLATLGAETLNAPRPEEALRAIAEVIRLAMGTDRCDITLTHAMLDEMTPSADAFELPARVRRIPLEARGTTVGTLVLSSDRPFLLGPDQKRVLSALSYYAALGVERVRLASAEDEAEALRHADRLKDALLASVSHDLRTPLTTIKGIANEIARGGDPDRAQVIEEEADRLTSLVDDLLDLSKLAAGEMEVHLAVNTADDVIGAVLQRVELAFRDRVIETELAEPWTDLVGHFDFVHTMRILTNLLDNAAKYGPAGSPVRLRVWREGDELRFAVEDEGAGIPAADQDRMFEPFVRGRSRPPGISGTGLGLSIARRLAEVQQGRLTYAPTTRVESRFVLSLPAANVPVAEPSP